MQTKLKNAGILIGFLVACLVARRLAAGDGIEPGSASLATGVIAGYLLGAAVALWGIAFQKHIARTRPSAVWMAYTVAFLTKFGGLAVGPMIAFLVPSLGARMDWRSFMIAYGFAAVIALLLGTVEVARALKTQSTQNSTGDGQSGSASSAPDSRTCI